jgi:predicted acylesterase/phospholipase RssA
MRSRMPFSVGRRAGPVCTLIGLLLCLRPSPARAGSASPSMPFLTAAFGLETRSLEPGDSARARPRRIGLALSGGGARGLAEVGVLKALEEAGIPIDCIAGTSMGAVVGGLYAAGVPVDSLEKIANRTDLFRTPSSYLNEPVYQKWALRPSSFSLYFSGWEYRLPISLMDDFNINWMLIEHATPANLEAGGDFDRLPIPFRTLALDLKSGEPVVFRSGDLARAIRSSMSVPVAFPPIPSRDPDRLLIDPGPVNNLPIDLLREMGAEHVIAVDCVEPWSEREVSEDPPRVASEMLRVLSQRVDSLSIQGWDIWIQPRIGRVRMYDFGRRSDLIRAGYEATWAQMDRIRALLPAGDTAKKDPPATIRDLSRAMVRRRVDWIRLEGRRGSYVWVPKSELHVSGGDPFTLEALGRGLRRLYGTNRYLSVWPWLSASDSGGVGVTLELAERPPARVSVGFLYDNSRKANMSVEVARDNLFRSGETFHAAALLGNYRDGGEAGLHTGRLRRLPISFDLLASSTRTRYARLSGGEFVRHSDQVGGTTVLGGSGSGMLMFGYRVQRDRGVGAQVVPDWNVTSRVAFGSLCFDNTDDRELPTRGERLRAGYEFHFENRTPAPVQSYEAEGSISLSFGALSLTPRASVAGLSKLQSKEREFYLWHRYDLTRATLGRFEEKLYAPFVAGTALEAGLRLASNLSFWARGTTAWRGVSFRELRRSDIFRGMEAGFLQRTPVGPVLLGSSWERGRKAFLFVQVGMDPLD